MNLLTRNQREATEPQAVGDYRIFDSGEMPETQRMMLVRKFGDQSLSYSAATQKGLLHFGNQSGFIAFQTKYGQTFALSDPVTAACDREAIITAFLERFPQAAFVQISEEVADILAAKNFWINQLGVDTRLDLKQYDFQGKEKERFRYAANWLLRRDYTVVELPFEDEVIEQTRALGERWRQTRNVKQETAFVNRPIEYINQPDMRRFFLLDAQAKIVAFVFFDPIYRNDEVIGYVTVFKRRDSNCPSVAEQGICKIAIEKFREEGVQVVKLGLSPLAQLSDGKFKHNWILKRSFKYLHRAGWVNRYFYNLSGHTEFKNRFRGTTEKTYFASPTFLNDFRLFALLRLCKIL